MSKVKEQKSPKNDQPECKLFALIATQMNFKENSGIVDE